MSELREGDFVRLVPREVPHDHPGDWWWQITNITDFGLDLIYTGHGARIRRQGVSFSSVMEVRVRDRPPEDDGIDRACAS